jgi:hypothetical protein
VGLVYDPRELLGVTTIKPRVVGVLHSPWTSGGGLLRGSLELRAHDALVPSSSPRLHRRERGSQRCSPRAKLGGGAADCCRG